MDFLSKMLIQLRELFMSMTPAARITSGLLLAVVLISVVYLFRFQSTTPDQYLFGGGNLTSAEVNNIAGELGNAGLKFKIEGTQILIPTGQEEKYFAALNKANALPVNWAEIKAEAMEKSSQWAGKSEREQRLKLATEKALAYAIRGMNDIENASVIYDIKTTSGLNREIMASAVVTVKPLGSAPLSIARVEDIKHTVAGGVAQLAASNVTVSDQNGRTHPATSTGDRAEEMSNQFKKLKRGYENDLKDKIYNLLSYVPGAVVSVRIELDTTAKETSHKVDLEQKSIPVKTIEETKITTEDNTTQGSTPGLRSNGANSSAALAKSSGGSKKSSDVSSTNISSRPEGTEINSTKAGMTPKRAKVSVGIPRSYFEMVWRNINNKSEEDEVDKNAVDQIEADEIKKIQGSILPLVPLQIDEPDPLLNVTVKSFHDPTKEPLPEPSFSNTAIGWLGQNWSTLGMATLGLFSLLVLRSMVKSTTAVTEPATSQAANTAPDSSSADDTTEEEDPGETVNRLMGRRGESGRSMKEDLADMVSQDPDTAANILKAWIAES